MRAPAASEATVDTSSALAYLRKTHGLKYSLDHLQLLARAGKVPAFKVGKYWRFRRSLLDQWALGEWKPTPLRKRRAS